MTKRYKRNLRIRHSLGMDTREWLPPVVEISGIALAPQKRGQGWYHTNKRGDLIRHPAAYSRKFGKPIYHRSTAHILVGGDWQ